MNLFLLAFQDVVKPDNLRVLMPKMVTIRKPTISFLLVYIPGSMEDPARVCTQSWNGCMFFDKYIQGIWR